MFNPLDPDSWLGLLEHWRFFAPLAVCVVLALAVYRIAGSTPDAAALAAFIGLVGLIAGGAWELVHWSRNRPLDP
jgi:hypothetical protein